MARTRKSNFPKDENLILTCNNKYYITINYKTKIYTAYDLEYNKLGTANSPYKLENKFKMYEE